MSRHHFLQPENFKPSQFRIRVPKKDYKNIYPKHLSISSQYLSNKNEYSYEQENDKYEENYGYEQEHRYEKENNRYEEILNMNKWTIGTKKIIHMNKKQ